MTRLSKCLGIKCIIFIMVSFCLTCSLAIAGDGCISNQQLQGILNDINIQCNNAINAARQNERNVCEQRMQQLMQQLQNYYASSAGRQRIDCSICTPTSCSQDESTFRKCLDGCGEPQVQKGCLRVGTLSGYLPNSVENAVLDETKKAEINLQSAFIKPILMNQNYAFGQAINFINTGLLAALKAMYNRINQNAPSVYQSAPQALLTFQQEIKAWEQVSTTRPLTPQVSNADANTYFIKMYSDYLDLIFKMTLFDIKMLVIYNSRAQQQQQNGNNQYQSSRNRG